MQQSALTPQQAAIQELHGRFERGELAFEDFEKALSQVLQAQSPEECWEVLHSLPTPPIQSFGALEIPSARPVVPTSPSEWIVSLIGEVKRIRHPWRMGQQTTAMMLIGEVELDLSMAALPQQGTLQVNMLIGEVKIYVPRSVQVLVRTTAVIGEVNALGQKAEGIIAHSQADNYHTSMSDSTTPHLEIQVNLLIGEVKVVQVDNPVIVDQLRRKEERRLKRGGGQAVLPQPKQDSYL